MAKLAIIASRYTAFAKDEKIGFFSEHIVSLSVIDLRTSASF